MKKLIIFALAVLTLAPAHAQFSLSKNRQAVFGKRMTQSPFNPPVLQSPQDPQNAVIIAPTYVPIDSLATSVFLGKGTSNSGAYITFGANKNVWIGEKNNNGTITRNVMQLGFTDGIEGICRKGTAFSLTTTRTNNSGPFRFYSDVRANSFVVDSDSRLKSNVRTIGSISSALSSLSPVSYTLTSQSAPSKDEASKLSAATIDTPADAPMAPDARTRYGFIAQEVKELFPDLVVEDENGTLGIDYIGFIPLLVDAVKNMQTRIDEQEEIIAILSGGQIKKSRSAATAQRDRLLAEGCLLEQNRPNPFSSTSVIACNIPASVTDADIFIYDLQGQQVLRLPIEARGSASVTIEGSALNPGMYIYSLIADGVEIDTKRMIVTD